MIENWNQASEEEEKFVRKEAEWLLIFSAVACLCVLPIGVLGIWQAYDIYAIYADGGISPGFLITSLLCGVVLLLAVLVFRGCRKNYRGIQGEVVYRSSEGRVEKTWQEKDGNTVTEYFSFSYKDFVTGEVKEHKSMNYGNKKNRLEEGDALSVLAYKKEDSLEIADVSKGQSEKKLEAFWLIMDGAVLAVLVLAWVFLFLDFGAASLYIRLGICLSLIAVAAVTLIYGIVERKAGAVVAALLLCGFMMITGVPASLKNISLDMGEGPRQSKAYLSTYERERVTRTRRGRRRSHHYYLNISSGETDMTEVEVTGAARNYYRKQNGGRVMSGRMIYYPHTKIFLYWLGENEGGQ